MTVSPLYKAEERRMTPAKIYTVKNIICVECREISSHKSNANEHYLDELTSRKIKSQVKEIVFLTSEDYHLFTNNLLDYYDWLSSRGGDDSHYKTKDGKDWTTPLSDYKEIAEWKKESYTKCILVTNGSDYILVDPQRQRYAQYVGWGIKTTLSDILEVAQLQLLIPPVIESAATIQPTIWQDATPEAEVNDIIRKPFCPIARVVGKEILPDGCTCLIVAFPGCRDHHAEEWVLEAVEVTLAPTSAAIREDNEQGRVQAIPEPIEPQDNASDKEWAEYEKAQALWLKHSINSPLSKSYKTSYKGKSIDQQKEERAAEKRKAQADATALLPIFVKRHLENRAYDEIRKAKGDYIDAGSPSVQSSEDARKTRIFSAKMSLKQKKAVEIYAIIAKQKAYQEYNQSNTQQGL